MSAASTPDTYLNWLKDECFFSLCSRQHIFWANTSARATLASLFESNIESYCHDFPRNLHSLNRSATSAWGNAEEIIDQHTIAPMFFPFQSADHVTAHNEAMKGNNLGPIKYKLGLITGQFGGEHPLKACSGCIIDDRRTHGVAYWRLSHQFPGVTICPAHNCLLKESSENRQWSKGFSFFIPSESILIEAGAMVVDDETFEILKNISNAAVKLGKLGSKTQFETGLVAEVYDAALKRLGTSRHDKEVAAQGFANHCLTLRKHPQFSSLPASNVCALTFTSKMTRKPRGYCHPLKHLVLISWLFGSIEAFVSAYERVAMQRDKSKVDVSSKIELPEAREGITSKVFSRTTIPKPKKMFEEVKNKILDSLERGTSKADICSGFGISTSTVNRILRLNPMIQEKINEMKNFENREEHRKQWSLVRSNNPGFGVKKIRCLIPDIYAWLYRNDKTWLTMQTSYLPNDRSGNNSKTDWEYRDDELYKKIEKALLMRNRGSKALRKYELYELVPGLYSALESKHHYPKTRVLLDEVTQYDFNTRPS